MNEQRDDAIKNEKLPILLGLLEEGQVIRIEPHGHSMFPFFLGGRDVLYISRKTKPLKRGDIALYRRKDGTYVVHRVHHVTSREMTLDDAEWTECEMTDAQATYAKTIMEYYMLGDHQIWIEGPLAEEQVYGVVQSFERKGHKIVCEESKSYRFLWNFWMRIRLLRPVICTTWDFYWKLRDRLRGK